MKSKYPERKKRPTEHGGSFLLGKRKTRRPLTTKTPIHVVLRSDFAYGTRSLLRHRPLIEKTILNASKRFKIRIYEKAVVGNHIHLLVKGKRREHIQNFFRVVAGHTAQQILKIRPLTSHEKKRRIGARRGERETDNKFWETRVYTRLVKWGRDFFTVKAYVIQNTLEALGLRAYKERKIYLAAG